MEQDTPATGQLIVVFTIDCRTRQQARDLLARLWTKLSQLYGDASRDNLSLSAVIFDVERHNWLFNQQLK